MYLLWVSRENAGVRRTGEWLSWIRHKIYLYVYTENGWNLTEVLSFTIHVIQAIRIQHQCNISA